MDGETLETVRHYFVCGGLENIKECLQFLCDRLLLTSFGYEGPKEQPEHGFYHPKADCRTLLAKREVSQAVVAVIFYRAHWLSGNLRFIDELLTALEDKGLLAVGIFTASLRCLDTEGRPLALALLDEFGARADALINTTSFSVSESPTSAQRKAARASAEAPVFQAIGSTMTIAQWQNSERGLTPLDTAMNVVLPEFDGRIITHPISFRADSSTGAAAALYETLPDRTERLSALVARTVRLRKLSNREKKVAFVLTNSSSKAAQIGNAVGLDSPASLMALLERMKESGYRFKNIPDSPDKLIHGLIDRCSYDEEFLTEAQIEGCLGRVSPEEYLEFFRTLPPALQEAMVARWGEPPGQAYIDSQKNLIVAGYDLGNAVVILQPPRGYGMDPNLIYHQPDLPPTHHYAAVYLWINKHFGADAVVHMGKHGTLEWLPGKGIGLSENCFPDALFGDTPLIYPFIINDPGEGSQAKRRSHAVIVDHLTPPMTTADHYGLLSQLVQLVDEYYQVELL
ncbi:MAG: hypothetical protein HC888_14560 [Candidatus Competibacteraceae bacterium]|nr:hypothetical protein [Candidatus Competibacteraceae bacterium]